MILTFEDLELRVVAPIDPLEGQRYVEQVKNEGKGIYLNNIYNITSIMDDYVNPMIDRKLSWHNVSSYTSDYGEALENW